jgi:hypothetical protein
VNEVKSVPSATTALLIVGVVPEMLIVLAWLAGVDK